jgi:PAS domain S-box-containing protein
MADSTFSQSKADLLVQSVTDYAIYMLDPQGIVRSWNPGAERLKGYSADEIIGQHFSRFYTPEDRAAGMPQRALETAMREGRFESEGQRVRKDGSRFWSHVVIDPIRAEDGTLLGFAKITRDVTERRQTQESLERAREALFQSQKMDAVGQLTGGVAHDFNNLLMAIMGSLDLLKKRLPADPQLHRLLDNALLGARRGATLTQRMLAFARRQDLDVKPLNLTRLVAGMADLLASSLGSSVEIKTAFPHGLGLAVGDENQVELALLNLCVNARDAMPNGGEIVIGAREEKVTGGGGGLRPGRYICLSVADTGEGMSPETLARASEPFFTTKGVGRGTGLGLSMVHGMAEQMGGRLVLQSELGQGTTAEIWLPALEGEASAASESAPSAAPSAAPRRLKVLAVDEVRRVVFNTRAMVVGVGGVVVVGVA